MLTITKFNLDWTVNKFEKVLLTNKSGNNLTVTRGCNGTTATTFDNDDYIFLNITAIVIQDLQDEVTRLETAKANDNAVVKLTGNQTIDGEKIFSQILKTRGSFVQGDETSWTGIFLNFWTPSSTQKQIDSYTNWTGFRDLLFNWWVFKIFSNWIISVNTTEAFKDFNVWWNTTWNMWISLQNKWSWWAQISFRDSLWVEKYAQTYIQASNKVLFYNGSSDFMAIDLSNGNLWLWITNPTSRLYVEWDSRIWEGIISWWYWVNHTLQYNDAWQAFRFKNYSWTTNLEIQQWWNTYWRTILPFVDNANTCGASWNRWSAIWAANWTIQTSDRRQKTDITESTLWLDFISKLNPVSYKWLNGANIVEKEEIEVEKEVQETQIIEYTEEKIEEKDGKFIKIIEKKTREEKVFDEVDLFDENGNQIFDEKEVEEFDEKETEVEKTEIVDGKAIIKIEIVKNKVPVIEYLDVYDENGNQIFDFIPTTKIIQNEDGEDEEIVEMVQTPRKMQKVKTKIEKIPRKVQVPKMVKKLVKEQKEVIKSKPGSRNHFGFIAQEVEEALGGVDFWGLVIDENGQYALRYDQFISPLVAAVKELKARVEFLESKIK